MVMLTGKLPVNMVHIFNTKRKTISLNGLTNERTDQIYS